MPEMQTNTKKISGNGEQSIQPLHVRLHFAVLHCIFIEQNLDCNEEYSWLLYFVFLSFYAALCKMTITWRQLTSFTIFLKLMWSTLVEKLKA